jgi:hypothetical protein
MRIYSIMGSIMASSLVNDLQVKAEERKKVYAWSEAAHLLEKAAAISHEKTEQAGLLESAGYCHSQIGRAHV